MIDDLPAIREQLIKHWQAVGIDLVKRGFRPEAVFETLLTVGLAGYVELHGREAAEEKLRAIAQKLADETRTEVEALEEARRSTKN